MSRIATISRRSAKPAVSSISNNAVASAADGGDATASEILAAAQRGAVEVSGMACIGASTAAIMPLLQPEKRFSRMRAHARAAAAALVLTLDEHLIEELCRFPLSFAQFESHHSNNSPIFPALPIRPTHASAASFLNPRSPCSSNSCWRPVHPAHRAALLPLMLPAAAGCDPDGCSISDSSHH